MTSPSHAEGRQLGPGQVYFCYSAVSVPVEGMCAKIASCQTPSSSGWDVGLWPRQVRKFAKVFWAVDESEIRIHQP